MGQKGFFSDLNLPVSRKYVFPKSRKWMFIIGGGGALLILSYFGLDATVLDKEFISNGPLSSNHANFESDCAACHNSFESVTNDKCSVCHEKYGDELGVYTFSAHYLYRSDDFQRVRPRDNEKQCYTCHPEHEGRNALITNVPDARCVQCHEFGSFNKQHPEFEFAAEQIPDNANVKFSHIKHIERVQKRENLIDIEKACLHCHNAKPDGKNFEPIDFEQHCDACHLTTTTTTPWLQTRSRNADTPGVLTLEEIRRRQVPGTLWAYYTNPNEFQSRGGRVRKSPVYHEDPWIVENLKLLRKIMYPDLGLVDLLQASGDVPPEQTRHVYREAIQTLTAYADELRGRPERVVQNDLNQIYRLVDTIERKLKDPYTPLDATKFLLSTVEPNPDFSRDELNQFNNFVDQLTEPCQQCHVVSNATIARAQPNQRVLTRAEFNHRDHILQRRCLDCHTDIPIAQFVGNSGEVTTAMDHAGIQNIPTIATCQQCHQQEVASNRCVTCHLFHPNKEHRSNLLLYLE